jgi:hypothetical protein
MNAKLIRFPERTEKPRAPTESESPPNTYLPDTPERRARIAKATELEFAAILNKMARIDRITAELWNYDSAQLGERLKEKYPKRHAIRLMWAARIIAAETMLDPEHPMQAAVRAAEKIENQGKEHRDLAVLLRNTRRKCDADKRVLEKFRAWEQRAAVEGMDTAQRVKKYCSLKNIPQREKRRIRALLKPQKII